MEISLEKLREVKEKVKIYYDSLKEIYCPYLKCKVKFASEGFHHIFYKNAGKTKERDKKSQYLRLKLFKLAPKLIKDSKTLQEYFCSKEFVLVKYNKRKEKIMKDVKYWGFIGIIDEKKIKVIIKQTGEGEKKFWSIIPNWTTRKSHEEKHYSTHVGDLEND